MKIFYKLGSLTFLALPLITIVSCSNESKTQTKKVIARSGQLNVLQNIDQLSSSKKPEQLKKIADETSSEKEITAKLIGIELPKIPSNLKWIIKIKSYDQVNQRLKISLSLGKEKIFETKTVTIVPSILYQEEKKIDRNLDARLQILANNFYDKFTKKLSLEDMLKFLNNNLGKKLEHQELHISSLPNKITTWALVDKTSQPNIRELKIHFLKDKKIIKVSRFKIDAQDVKNLYDAKQHLENLEYLKTDLQTREKVKLAFNTYKSKNLIDLAKIGIRKQQFPIQDLAYGVLSKEADLANQEVTIVVKNKIREIMHRLPLINIEDHSLSVNALRLKGLLVDLSDATYRRFLSTFNVEVIPGTVIHHVEAKLDHENNQNILTIKYTLELPGEYRLRHKIKVFVLRSLHNQHIVQTSEWSKVQPQYYSNINLEDFEKIVKSFDKDREIKLDELKAIGVNLPQFDPETAVRIYLKEAYWPADKSFKIHLALNYRNAKYGEDIFIIHK